MSNAKRKHMNAISTTAIITATLNSRLMRTITAFKSAMRSRYSFSSVFHTSSAVISMVSSWSLSEVSSLINSSTVTPSVIDSSDAVTYVVGQPFSSRFTVPSDSPVSSARRVFV